MNHLAVFKDLSFLAEYWSIQYFLVRCTTVCLVGCGCSLIAPFLCTVSLSSVCDVGRRLFGHSLQLIYYLTAFEKVKCTIFARLQTEIRVHCRDTIVFAGLVAVDDNVTFGGYRLVGQLPGLADLVFGANLIVLQIDGCICRIIQLHPRVRKIVQVVHDTVHIRLHQFVND